MIKTIIILFYIFIIYWVNFFLTKNNFIPNYTGNLHQKFFNKNKIQLSGGIFLLPVLVFINYDYSSEFILAIVFIFILGLLSDLSLFSSAKARFMFQFIIIFLFLFFSETKLTSVRIDFIDFILENNISSLIFTLFCLMILVNGTNFIDGLNGLVLNYYLVITLIIFKLGLFEFSKVEINDIYLIIIILFYLTILNFLNKLYLGDSGSYLLGFVMGYLLIDIYESSYIFSPYFIALLLWYPAFEILFSIIRKMIQKKSPLKPDNRHLHHLLFSYIKIKNRFKNISSNNLTSFLIIFYNMFIFIIASFKINFTIFQVSLILLNVLIYLSLYIKLNRVYLK
ncbi:hypothetical protein OAN07_01635 [Candidatus Pelagibacter sp.]|nr:hypothetical protein [Candidatus Pelagibacter sp.]